MDFDVARTNNFAFKGSIIQNKVLEKCVSHLSPNQLKEYNELVSIAERTSDNKILEMYERTAMIRNKKQISYNYYVGIRDRMYCNNYGEELVGKSSKKGNTTILWGYTDAILKPLRKIYNKSLNVNV